MEGNLRFKIDWASLIVERKFAVSALFYFLLGQPYSWKEIYRFCFVGALEGRFYRGFFCYKFRGLIFGRAYTWRGLFSEMFFLGGGVNFWSRDLLGVLVGSVRDFLGFCFLPPI